MKGHGVQVSGKEAGDLLAEIQIVLGEGITSEAKALYQQLAELSGEAKQREQLRAKLVW